MKGILYLNNGDNLFDKDFQFRYDSEFDYSIEIEIDNKRSFKEIINSINKSDIEESVDGYLELLSDMIDDDFKENIKKEKNLIENAEYISFDFDTDFIYEYINKNPILKTKKIVILNPSLNYDELLNIKNKFKSDTSCLYFKPEGNSSIVTFDEYKSSLEKIEKIIEKVKKSNFSPIEKIMYVYDIVKGRIYTKEDLNDDKDISRDLTKVLLQDKIVCAGYSNILNKILSELGINIKSYYLRKKNTEIGHQRNIVYIKDEKYRVDGIYYLDATWDSKRYISDINYLNFYNNFLKTKQEISNDKYEDLQVEDFNSKFIEQFENQVRERGLNSVDKKVIETINYLSIFIDNTQLIKKYMYAEEDIKKTFIDLLGKPDFNLEYTINKLKEYNELLNRPINGEIFLDALLNVRKVEYYENGICQDFNLSDFYIASLLSNWKFKETKTEKLLKAIFDEVPEVDNKKRIKNCIIEKDIPISIERVKLAYTLRKVLNNKCENK